jgi:hypothetical protein
MNTILFFIICLMVLLIGLSFLSWSIVLFFQSKKQKGLIFLVIGLLIIFFCILESDPIFNKVIE